MNRPARPSSRPAQPRNNALAQIHIAAQALGMDTADQNPDSEYRRMLHAHGRVTSAAKLDHAGRAAVVRHLDHLLVARGLKPGGPAHPGKPRAPAPDRASQIKKIEALLADAGRPWAYLDGMVKRICKVDKLEFCDPDMLHKLISALMYDKQRRAKAAIPQVGGVRVDTSGGGGCRPSTDQGRFEPAPQADADAARREHTI